MTIWPKSCACITPVTQRRPVLDSEAVPGPPSPNATTNGRTSRTRPQCPITPRPITMPLAARNRLRGKRLRSSRRKRPKPAARCLPPARLPMQRSPKPLPPAASRNRRRTRTSRALCRCVRRFWVGAARFIRRWVCQVRVYQARLRRRRRPARQLCRSRL